jgi:hypothetical protein
MEAQFGARPEVVYYKETSFRDLKRLCLISLHRAARRSVVMGTLQALLANLWAGRYLAEEDH